MSAGDKNVYTIAELWPNHVKEQDTEELYRDMCSDDAFKDYYDRFISDYNWKDNGDMVIYGVEIRLDILRTKTPDLLMVHFIHR